MIRRIPSSRMPFVLVFLLAVAVGYTPCAATEETEEPGIIVNRNDLRVDGIKPGDDDQPTIGGRRHGQVGDLGAPDAIPTAVRTREPSPGPSRPAAVLRNWIETVRALVARIRTTLR